VPYRILIGLDVRASRRVACSRVSLAFDSVSSFFFFQAEDGIRDRNVTGVQTCALPISFGVGTRSAIPCNFPSRWGSTMPSAFAAPVEVGIIDWVHPRALRKSLCGLSKFF